MTDAHLSLCQLWDMLQTVSGTSPVISHPPNGAVPAIQLASDMPRAGPGLWDCEDDGGAGKESQAAGTAGLQGSR